MSGIETERRSDPIEEAIYEALARRVHFATPVAPGIVIADWSNERLKANNLPSRPPENRPLARELWVSAVENLKLVSIDPDTTDVRRIFQIDQTRRHRARQRPTPGSSSNWSGAVLGIPEGWACQSVYASWVVPSAKPGVPPASATGPYTWQGSAWIGLDGYLPGSISLPQLGSTHIVDLEFGTLTPTANLWWQWWIDDDPTNHPIVFPVTAKPGDRVTALLTVRNPLRVNFFIKNLDTGLSFSMDVDAPAASGAPVPIEQENVEWIVERQTEIGGTELLPFANYDRVDFTSCLATFADADGLGETIDLTAPVTLQIVDWTNLVQPGQIISTYDGGDFDTVQLRFVP